MRTRFFYLMEIQYLGFRYHGWQKQPNVITVQEMITKTLNWVLPETASKVLASGRTDAKVSVNQTYIGSNNFTKTYICCNKLIIIYYCCSNLL